MKNVKDQVYKALSKKFENVTDSYPQNWALLPAIQLTEEENRVHEKTKRGEEKSYVRYRIDIWDNKSTSQPALDVDEAISALGLVRTNCQDVEDKSEKKHKVARYEGIIDMHSENVYWTN